MGQLVERELAVKLKQWEKNCPIVTWSMVCSNSELITIKLIPVHKETASVA
jgi:hypothetical protein